MGEVGEGSRRRDETPLWSSKGCVEWAGTCCSHLFYAVPSKQKCLHQAWWHTVLIKRVITSLDSHLQALLLVPPQTLAESGVKNVYCHGCGEACVVLSLGGQMCGILTVHRRQKDHFSSLA